MDIEAVGNENGISASNGGYVNVNGNAQDRNYLLLDSNTSAVPSSSGISSVGVGSRVYIQNMNITSTNNTLAIVRNDGKLVIEDSDIVVTDGSSGITATAGNGSVELNDVYFITKNTIFEASGTSNLTFDATDSVLTGTMQTASSANSTVTLDNVEWNTSTASSVGTLNLTDTIIDMRTYDDNTFNTLSTREYHSTGDNNLIKMNTELNSDASQTDQIIITTDSSGTTVLDIENKGGMGLFTYNGILIVDNQAATQGATFKLKDGMLEQGAVQYHLMQAGANDPLGRGAYSWYLRTTGFNDVMKAMINVPEITMQMARAGMGNLNKRLGDLRNQECGTIEGLWVRNYNKHFSVDDHTKSTMDLYGIEAGYDFLLDINSPDRYYLGFSVGYMALEDVEHKQYKGSRSGQGDGYSPTVGIYATWLSNQGYFMDIVIKSFWTDLDMTSYALNNVPVNNGPSRQITAGSVEFGQKNKYYLDRYSSLVFEPKMQLMLAYAESESLTASNGHLLDYSDTTSLTSRLALLLGYQGVFGDCSVLEPFIELGIAKEFMGRTKITYAGLTHKNKVSSVVYDATLGINAHLGTNTALYGALTYEKGSKYEAFSSNLGVRYTW
jgi:autotransporter family porin